MNQNIKIANEYTRKEIMRLIRLERSNEYDEFNKINVCSLNCMKNNKFSSRRRYI